MFGLGKSKPKTVEDESIRDKSKFAVVGFTVMFFTFLAFIIAEIYTTLQISKQNRLIANSGSVQEESDKTLLEMSKMAKR